MNNVQITKTHILMQGMRFYAYHGVLPQEQKVGAFYTVHLKLRTDFAQACLSDNLSDTISYAEVFEVVKETMSTPSQLLEHVAGRIGQRLFSTFPTITHIDLELFKENPPMGADATHIGISVNMERKG